MEKHAYCSECRRYVALAGEDCPQGHARDALRDVRSGPLPVAASQRQTPAVAVGGDLVAPASLAQSEAESAQATGKIVGWIVVVVPSLIFGVVAVAITEPQFEGSGIHGVLAWFLSFVSVVVTLGAAAAWGYLKFVRRRNR